MYSYIQDKFVHAEHAFLHVSDLSVQRGYGVFDFCKVQDGHVFFLNDYLERFYNSAKLMHLTVPYQPEELQAIIHELVGRNRIAASGIKMILTGGYSADGYQLTVPNLIITQHPLTLPGNDLIESGVKIITHEYVRDLAAAKTINYTMGIWLINKLKENQAFDVLYVQNNSASEFPRCNFFIVTKDDTVVTPTNNVLYGITRKNILKLASLKYKTEEGTITLSDIHEAKEAFLTSTTKRIVPIVQFNDLSIGNGKPGPVSISLLKDLIALEQEDLKGGK